MNLPCLHAYRLPLMVHAGGCMTGSFEGRPVAIDSEFCLGCGEIRLFLKHLAALKAFLEESSAGRKQT